MFMTTSCIMTMPRQRRLYFVKHFSSQKVILILRNISKRQRSITWMIKLSIIRSRLCSIEDLMIHFPFHNKFMIIHSALHDPLCYKTRYSHSTQTLTHTVDTVNLLRDFRKTFHSKKKLVLPSPKVEKHFNKYYINPENRYKCKSFDPKKDRSNLKNDEYIYSNLHNNAFNHWRHPLNVKGRSSQSKLVSLNDDNLLRLLKFKQQFSQGGKGRLPMIVSEMVKTKN